MTALEVGVVTRPHGIRGELKVRLHWEGSEALARVPRLSLRCGGNETTYRVESARRNGRNVLLRLAGVDDRNAAEALRGASVLVERGLLPKEPGEVYLVDLIGAEVWVAEQSLGRVVEVRANPTVDSLIIERPDGSRVEQPLLEHWLAELDADAGRVTLTSSDGIIE